MQPLSGRCLEKSFDSQGMEVGCGSAIQEGGNGQQRAFRLVGLVSKNYWYITKCPDDASLRQRLKGLALKPSRLGYTVALRLGTRPYGCETGAIAI
jgi:hypothetical protein